MCSTTITAMMMLITTWCTNTSTSTRYHADKCRQTAVECMMENGWKEPVLPWCLGVNKEKGKK